MCPFEVKGLLLHEQNVDCTQQQTDGSAKLIETEVNNQDITRKDKLKEREKEASESKSKSKGKKEKSPSKSKKSGDKSNTGKKKKSSDSNKPLHTSKVESVEAFIYYFDEEVVMYDTSRLTVAEYYEMLELEPGLARKDFLREKLGRYTEDLQIYTSTGFNAKEDVRSTYKPEFKCHDLKIFGTLKKNKVPEGYAQEGVTKIIEIRHEKFYYLKDIAECGVNIFIINEDADQISEAIWLFSTILNYIEEIKETEDSKGLSLPIFILVSSFMTWSLTKSLNSVDPELPFTEKDYRKRKPHPNYQLHYELEEQVLKVKMSGLLEVVILTCGIPYGHEEDVFSYLFKMAYNCLDLPLFGSIDNTIPVIHVENIGQIIRKILKRSHEIKFPFIFAKDPLSDSVKDIVKAISNNFGSRCCRLMPGPFSFLNDEITQDIYDQMTADMVLESCYPLFSEADIKWKYETGLVNNVKQVIKEYMDAKKLKPINIVFYGSVNDGMQNIALKLCEHYHIPYLCLENVLLDYVNVMEEKVMEVERFTDIIGEVTQRKSINKHKYNFTTLDCIHMLKECDEHADLEKSLEFFRGLNITQSDDVDVLTEIQKISILKERVKERSCLNHGYILYEFPKTQEQAEMLFCTDDENIVENEYDNDNSILPDYVVYLHKHQESSPDLTTSERKEDELNVSSELKTGSLSIIESMQDDTLYEEDKKTENNSSITVPDGIEEQSVIKELTTELTPSSEEFTLINFLLTSNEKCKLIKINVTECNDADKIIQIILEAIKENSSIDLVLPASIQNKEEETIAEMCDDQPVICYEKEEEIGDMDKMSINDIQDVEFQKLKESEEVILAVRSCPYIKFLISFIFPTLTNAILEVSARRPEDPLDFLAEYLFKNNPDGRMMDPRELQSKEDLENQEKCFPNVDSKACLA